jgi:hypothetical protein
LICGQHPIQHMVIREFCRLWNRLIDSTAHNAIIMDCLQQQVLIHTRSRACWLRRWARVFWKLLPTSRIPWYLTNLQKIPEQQVMQGMQAWYESLLSNMLHPSDPGCTHRKIATSRICMQPSRWGRKSRLLQWKVPSHVLQSCASLMCGNSAIPVHDHADTYSERTCLKCDMHGVIGDEKHVLLECYATAGPRRTFESRLLWPGSLEAFFTVNDDAECALFIHDALTAYARAAPFDSLSLATLAANAR